MSAEFKVTCPHCGQVHDAHSAADGDENAVPVAGNISFCFKCGGLSAYGQDLQLVHLTPEQIAEVDQMKELQKMTAAWLQVRRWKS